MTENPFMTTDYIQWRDSILRRQSQVEPDKLIFPEELKDIVSGYMTQPIATIDGATVAAVSRSGESFQEALDYLREQSKKFDVYIYQILWRHMTVDGYTINSIIVRFATTDKTNEE
jgi:hypothetical protein